MNNKRFCSHINQKGLSTNNLYVNIYKNKNRVALWRKIKNGANSGIVW